MTLQPLKRTWLCYCFVPVLFCVDFFSKAAVSRIVGGSKSLIPGLLKLNVLHNRGLFLGIGESGLGPDPTPSLLISLIPWLAFVVICGLALATPLKKTKRHLGFACMIGGALGNMLDRFIHGYVVDFIQLLFLPILNLADLMMVTGLVLVAADLIGEKIEA